MRALSSRDRRAPELAREDPHSMLTAVLRPPPADCRGCATPKADRLGYAEGQSTAAPRCRARRRPRSEDRARCPSRPDTAAPSPRYLRQATLTTLAAMVDRAPRLGPLWADPHPGSVRWEPARARAARPWDERLEASRCCPEARAPRQLQADRALPAARLAQPGPQVQERQARAQPADAAPGDGRGPVDERQAQAAPGGLPWARERRGLSGPSALAALRSEPLALRSARLAQWVRLARQTCSGVMALSAPRRRAPLPAWCRARQLSALARPRDWDRAQWRAAAPTRRDRARHRAPGSAPSCARRQEDRP